MYIRTCTYVHVHIHVCIYAYVRMYVRTCTRVISGHGPNISAHGATMYISTPILEILATPLQHLFFGLSDCKEALD